MERERERGEEGGEREKEGERREGEREHLVVFMCMQLPLTTISLLRDMFLQTLTMGS